MSKKVEIKVGETTTYVDVPDGSDINVSIVEDEPKVENSPEEKKVLKGGQSSKGNILKG